ncbi:hypothetical protein OG21DRAFT_1504109 [Imleria badia]|nr:hypothetical protein OG21DRAFT_1504109 [Imleria badia]
MTASATSKDNQAGLIAFHVIWGWITWIHSTLRAMYSPRESSLEEGEMLGDMEQRM